MPPLLKMIFRPLDSRTMSVVEMARQTGIRVLTLVGISLIVVLAAGLCCVLHL